jgi:uncharacterized protein
LLEILAYLLTGMVAGVMAGLLGVGGGLVIVPVLVWLFRKIGMDESIVMHLVVGTSLATIVVTSISSVRSHHKRGAVRWPLFRQLAPGIVVGALLGAAIAEQLDTLWLQRVFGLFAIIVSFQMAFSNRVKPHRQLPGRVGMASAGGLIGMVSSVVGIGGGSMTVPFLSWNNVPMVNAVATSSACGLPIAVAGAAGFLVAGWGNAALPAYSSGYLYWPAVAGIVVTSFLMAPVGAGLAHSLPVKSLRKIFAALLLVIGIQLVIN